MEVVVVGGHGDVERELAWLVLVEKGRPVVYPSLVLAIKVLDVLIIKPGW